MKPVMAAINHADPNILTFLPPELTQKTFMIFLSFSVFICRLILFRWAMKFWTQYICKTQTQAVVSALS